MHARRLLIMAALDKLKEASETNVPTSTDSNVADMLHGGVVQLDMTRIGLMGHSRGGDAVSSFVQYDQTRPAGERFPLRAVVSIAPVDYERHSPYGVPYMSVFGSCDGDVSNLQGARLYERSQYQNNDPYPRIQVVQVGGNHDAYNTVWQADGDDASQLDAACGPDAAGSKGQVPTTENGLVENVLGSLTHTNPHNIRLSGEAGPYFEAVEGESKPYRWGNADKLNPLVNTRISGNPALMGDQEKMGLATVSAFLRRYVGGEGAFEPYLTGELAAEGEPSIPQSACPTSEAGRRIPCIDRVADSYTAPPAEREDVLRPDTEHPTTVDALGTPIEAKGFVNPYPEGGGVTPRPATTANGIDWCDPDPQQTEPGLLKEEVEFPTAAKSCPQPAAHTLGGQGKNEVPGTESTREPRENAPVNGSYGRQLSLAWEGKATMGLPIPAADADVSRYKALYMATAVNFFDPRNPARGEEGLWNPEAAPQNFTIAVTDAEGREATVEAGDPRFGTALQQTLGSTSNRVHVLLRDLRVPLEDFADQGVDLTELSDVELRFGGKGMPGSGSIQLADVRFEQPASGFSDVLLDSTTPNAGPGEGPTENGGPNPVAEWEGEAVYKRADGKYEIPNVTKVAGANVWTVDDNKVQCPNAQFTHIQEAVEYANPWDTIVVCAGTYAESSKAINSAADPVLAAGEVNGLTIEKPLKIVGAGAGLVTIKPATTLTTLGGATGTLRDGGGNVITVARQSLGSTEYDEQYVDISGVTIESGTTTAEAGVAFFNSSGRIADSKVGPIKAANGTGWGVVETNSLSAEGEGAPERQVTIEDSKVSGYGAGGVLFDGSKGGADGAATNTVRSGMNQVGYVIGSTIEGSGGTATVAQTGIAFRSGAHGSVTGSSIAKNHSTTATGASYGVLAADAGALSVTGSSIAGNGGPGYGLYNGNAAVTGVSTGAPVIATGDFWGTAGTPIAGESVLGPPDQEGVEGPATTTPVAGAAPTVPAVPSSMPDSAPVGEIVDPVGGEAAEAGVTMEPIVFAEDDYGVRFVTLEANGSAVKSIGEAPYAFKWTPSQSTVGTSVVLKATIVDSAGNTTTTQVTVPVVPHAKTKAERELAEEREAQEEAEAEAAAELAAAEARLKEAQQAAEAAAKAAAEAAATAKAAEDSSAAAAKAAAEKAESDLKAAEAKVAAAEQEVKEAKEKAASISFGKVTKNTKKGVGRLDVEVPSPGALTIYGPDIKKVSGHPTGPGEIQVRIAAKGAGLKTLNKTGKVTVKVKAKLTGPDGTKTATTAVTLVKK
jgi:hypothetical protein